MHYKNGREAKNGDEVVYLGPYGVKTIGILYDALPGNDGCNGRLATISPTDPTPDLQYCLHVDDVKAADVPDVTKPKVEGDGLHTATSDVGGSPTNAGK